MGFRAAMVEQALKDLAAGELLLKGAFEDYENVGLHQQGCGEVYQSLPLFATKLSFLKPTTLRF